MEKNTIWALVLSGIVLFASIFIETTIILPKQQAKAEAEAAKQATEQAATAEKIAAEDAIVSTPESFTATTEADATETVDQVIPEETYTITTNKVKVTFTNKGGDVTSYQLLEHKDKQTGNGVEMVNNVTSDNRAFALALGDSNGAVLNDTFNVKKIDDYTIGFYRDYIQKDDLGNPHKINIAKLYAFSPDDYAFKLTVTIDTGAEGKGLNVNGVSYTLRSSPQIGPRFDNKKDRSDVRQYVSYNGSKKTRKNFSDKTYDKAYTWVGVAGKYFCELINPLVPTDMTLNVACSTKSTTGYVDSQILVTRAAFAQNKIDDTYYIYVGPRSEKELIKYNNKEKNAWGLFNAKYNEALQTSAFLSLIEIALKWSMEMINKLVHNWGVSIIILTIILKIILFPLSKKSAVGTLKMQQIQPQMTAIQEKYKDNQQKLSEETTKLYKESGYNPVSGCLPMILQMIILFALYNVFNNYFEFRGASFIPGWIDDLSVGDRVWTWEKQIPLISSFTMNNLRILPIIYTVSQLLNGMITQYGGAGATNAQSKMQMNLMMYGMPILFFFLFYNVSSGLLLYWTVRNSIKMGQQLVINKMMEKKRIEMNMAKPEVNKNVLKFKGGKKKTR